MKKHICLIITIIVILCLSSVKSLHAATSTPAPTDTKTTPTTVIDKLKQIELLKEKIATKVAEIRQTEKSAASGNLKSIKDNIYTISGKTGDQTITRSDDAIFFRIESGVKSDPMDAQGIKKIKTGEQFTVFGYFDTTHSTYLAKYIYVSNIPARISGKIIEKDAENYTISISQPQGNVVVDIETTTKIFVYSPKTGLTKGGFSKLKINDTISLFASQNPKDENRVSAVKIIDLTTLLITPAPTLSKEASPSAKPTVK